MNWIYIDRMGSEREYPAHPKQISTEAFVITDVLTEQEETYYQATYRFADGKWYDKEGELIPVVIAWRYP